MAKTRDVFLEDAFLVHGDRYDYSLVEYTNSRTPVKIVCPDHGVFEQTPGVHLKGCVCPDCPGKQEGKKKVRPSTEEWVAEARAVHGEKYDYSRVVYESSQRKVVIGCPEHGVFEQLPGFHLSSATGCPSCSKKQQGYSTEEWVAQAREVHGEKYDYSLAEYTNSQTKVRIVCPEHGVFEQPPSRHLSGSGCPHNSHLRNTTEDFIVKARAVHGDRYDYSEVEYVRSSEKVIIGCPDHGPFHQTPQSHLAGHGCSDCAKGKWGEHLRSTTEEFIEKARAVHGDRYDYSAVEYTHSQVKVDIGCSIHGVFEQLPAAHLNGTGCPACGLTANRYDQEDFIRVASTNHKGKFDYSRVEYVDRMTKVTIVCPEHGAFEQNPGVHLNGRGCPVCGGGDKTRGAVISRTMSKRVRRARKMENLTVRYTAAELEDHFELWEGGCGYCGVEISLGEMEWDHWIPVSRGGPEALFNLVPSCKNCNSRDTHNKSDSFPREWALSDRSPAVWARYTGTESILSRILEQHLEKNPEHCSVIDGALPYLPRS